VDLVQIRNGTNADLERIFAIEKACFEQPWSLTSFKRELSLPFSRIAVAVGPTEAIEGYLCRWMVVDELHVLNIAVHPDFRRHGVGARLLEDSISEAKSPRWRFGVPTSRPEDYIGNSVLKSDDCGATTMVPAKMPS
jgi:ribosomal-protein-alanine N-acetyltransferase